MRDFFREITGQVSPKTQGTHIYNQLIFSRFYDAISGANPVLFSLISKEKSRQIVQEFIKSGYAKGSLLWQISKEFRSFLKKRKDILDFPFLDELLWFEYSEIDLFMRDFSDIRPTEFKWDFKFKLGKNAILRILKYAVHNGEFETSRRTFLLAYYDISKKRVFYIELNEFMYRLIRKIVAKNGLSALECFDILSSEYDVKGKEKTSLKSQSKEALCRLCELGVLAKV